jgi:hypothetical protein
VISKYARMTDVAGTPIVKFNAGVKGHACRFRCHDCNDIGAPAVVGGEKRATNNGPDAEHFKNSGGYPRVLNSSYNASTPVTQR